MTATRVTIPTTAWTQITAGGATNMMLQMRGAGLLCYGGVAGQPLDVGFSYSDGDPIILPAGLSAHAVSVGAPGAAIIGPFGV